MTLNVTNREAREYLEATRLSIPSHLYRGCGKVWAAVRDRQVVAIRYMSDFTLSEDAIPAWAVEYWQKSNQSINCPWGYFRLPGRSKLVRITDEIRQRPDCPKRPSGKPLSRGALESLAIDVVERARREAFGRFREAARRELAALGEVLSGHASGGD